MAFSLSFCLLIITLFSFLWEQQFLARLKKASYWFLYVNSAKHWYNGRLLDCFCSPSTFRASAQWAGDVKNANKLSANSDANRPLLWTVILLHGEAKKWRYPTQTLYHARFPPIIHVDFQLRAIFHLSVEEWRFSSRQPTREMREIRRVGAAGRGEGQGAAYPQNITAVAVNASQTHRCRRAQVDSA